MKKILVPVDFSTQSGYATNLAAKIAKKTESNVYLLHMIEMPTGIIDMGAGSKFSIPSNILYINKVKNKLKEIIKTKFDSKITVNYSILFRNPFQGISEFSKKINPDLIIMGSKSSSEFDEIIIGSTTDKVVKTLKTPILVVKNDTQDFNIKDLIFASDFQEESKKSFRVFLDFAEKFKSKIHLLKLKGKTSTKETVQTFLNDFNTSGYVIDIHNMDTIEKGVLDFSKNMNTDLIAISTHRRDKLSRFFKGSIIKNLTKRTLKPVISFLI